MEAPGPRPYQEIDTVYPYTDLHRPPPGEVEARLERFREGLVRQGLDGALVTQRLDLFYYAGTAQEGWLWVPASGEPRLLIRRDLGRARRESPLSDIVPLGGMDDLTANLPRGLGRLGLELDVLPAALYLNLAGRLAGVEAVDVSGLIRAQRAVKSDYELVWHRRAADLNHEMFARISGWLEPGLREVELASRIEAFYRRRGHLGPVRTRAFNSECFYGHIMSGPNLAEVGAAPGPTTGLGLHPSSPQSAGWRRIGRGEPVSVDYVAVAGGYQIDQARIFSLGEAPDPVRRAHEAGLKVQSRIAAEAGPGVPCVRLYELALEVIGNAGFESGFMGGVPFVGHGIGLELDEWPVIGRNSAHVLEPGMVFALEPKILLPGLGMGGIENSFLVTDSGLDRLTPFPDKIQIV